MRVRPRIITTDSHTDLSVLAVADLHAHDVGVLRTAVEQLAPDLVVFAGDGLHDCARQSHPGWLREIVSQTKYGVFAVAGNADGPAALRDYGGERVYDLHERPVEIGPIRFIGLHGAPKINSLSGTEGLGAPLYSEAAAAAHLARMTKGWSGPTVIVSHTPPHGILDESRSMGGQVGSHALRAFLSAKRCDARLVICGHVHACRGQEARIENATIWNVASSQYYPQSIGVLSVRLQADPGRCMLTPVHPSGAYLPWSAVGELGFLPRMETRIAQRLVTSGITRLTQLVETDSDAIRRAIGGRHETAMKWAARAQAYVSGTPVLRAPLAIGPAPRHYFDIETDPWGAQECIWAVALRSDDSPIITQWFLRTSRGQQGMLRSVATALEAVQPGALYSYSGSRFDERILTSHLERHSITVPASLVASVDLHPAVTRAVAFPRAERYKEVLKALDIAHRDNDLDGFDAASMAMRALAAGKQIPERLLRYNREDVRTLPLLAKAITEATGITAPLERKRHSSGGAWRKAADQRRADQLLARSGWSLETLAAQSRIIQSRVERGARVTALASEIALREL